ncbi:MAG: rhodanese-like domain-containing protein [Rhodobacteraceae bacterium]|nr:rhodanese-like domain-containing protein [Paracoccaceae bacterium]
MPNSSNYAGNVDVQTAFKAVTENEKTLLVDVRTQAEWQFVGVPNLSAFGTEPVFVEWQHFGPSGPNVNFLGELIQKISEKGLDQSASIFFLCRSGARSQSAAIALTEAGFTNCYNIIDGFEGPQDQNGHRGIQSGWKASGLPWAQS